MNFNEINLDPNGNFKYPQQHWQCECLADRFYRFMRKEGEDSIWQFKGMLTIKTVRVKPNGKVEDITED